MPSLGIRHRLLLITLLPAVMVAVLTSWILVDGHMKQAYLDQQLRLSAIARQLAAAAEFDIFSGHLEGLNKKAGAALLEPDILAVAILDKEERSLVSTTPTPLLPALNSVEHGFTDFPDWDRAETEHWHALTIRPETLYDPNLFDQKPEQAAPIGYLLVKVSTSSLRVGMKTYAMQAGAIAFAVMLLGMGFARLLAHKLINALTDIGRVVQAVSVGGHDLRVATVPGNDELSLLAAGINDMAQAVGQTQEDLFRQVSTATASLKRERDEAAQAAESRSRFFAAASHDLRQPAHALGLFVARLEQEANTNTPQPQLHKIAEGVRNLNALLDALLDYSRLDGRIVKIDTRPTHANSAIKAVLHSLAGAAQSKNLSLRSRIADCWLLTDPVLLQRILLNLIGNAVRYTTHGGVLVTCRRRAYHARIDVWDTGPGISPVDQQRIFEELVQLNNPERDATKGLGLGLAIVRRSADLLFHPLSLCSRVGHGTRFSITIPLAATPAAEIADNSDTAMSNERDSLVEDTGQVLLIGTVNPSREEMACQLTGWGYVVATSDDLDAANACVARLGTPTLVILDQPTETDGLAWLDRVDAQAGHPVPAVIIGDSRHHAEPTGNARRLRLSRPYRPSRLRALLTHLQASEDQIDPITPDCGNAGTS